MPESHWLTQYDPRDGEPYGSVCRCPIGEDHDLAEMENEDDAADEPFVSHCLTCTGGIHWIECPTGGWWAHDVHPADHHDAVSPVCVKQDIDNQGYWFSTGLESDDDDA